MHKGEVQAMKKSSIIFFSILLSLFSCQEDEPTEKVVVLESPRHVSSTVEDFENKSFLCCDTADAHQVIAAYLALTEALAADQGESSTRAATHLVNTTRNAAENAEGEEQELLNRVVEKLGKWPEPDIELIRGVLHTVSNDLVDYARAHTGPPPEAEANKIAEGFCPMAPGRWLQTNPTLQNPYYGAAMLTCGIFEDAPTPTVNPEAPENPQR